MLRSAPAAIVILCMVGPVAGQTRFGVVWDPPADRLEAAADLRAIRATGFTAVRTRLLDEPLLLDLADTLGLDLYQEVSVSFATGTELALGRGGIQARLGRALVAAEGHPSARHFGVAYAPATGACGALASLASWVRPRAAPDVRVYFVTWAAGRDACEAGVDLVLHDDPAHGQTGWAVPRGGLAALGYAVDPRAPPGSRVPGSEEAQAAWYGHALPDLARSAAGIVFLYRWQDSPGTHPFHPAPYGRRYGLHDESGRARPARSVVQRFLVDGQDAFGFEFGKAATNGNEWGLLAGWLVFASVAAMLAASARFRSMIPRYFFAHGFYRTAVHEGRNIPGFVTGGLLALLGTAIGVVACRVAADLMDWAPVHAFWFRGSAGLRSAIDHLAEQPVVLALLAGSGSLVATVAWMAVWSFAVNRRSGLKASQVLVLAVWPRWPMLALLAGAMLGSTFPAHDRPAVAFGLCAAWLAAALWGTARTVVDLGRVARVHPLATLVLWLFSPVVLLAAGLATAVLLASEVARFYLALAGSGS